MNKRNIRGFKLTSDWVFKLVYGSDSDDSRAALRAFLNVVLARKDDPIKEVNVTNPIVLRETDAQKEVIFDIRATTNLGEMLDIEMQTYGLDKYPLRALYNGGKLISSSLEKGKDYDKMRRAIVISVIDGIVFKDIPKKHTIFKVCEQDSGTVMTDRAEWHFLELGKLEEPADPDLMSEEEMLMAYIKYVGEDDMEDYLDELLKKQVEVIEMSERMINEISEDTLAIWRRDSLEKAERDRISRDNMIRKEDTIRFVRSMRGINISDEVILEALIIEYQLSEEEAREYLL